MREEPSENEHATGNCRNVLIVIVQNAKQSKNGFPQGFVDSNATNQHFPQL